MGKVKSQELPAEEVGGLEASSRLMLRTDLMASLRLMLRPLIWSVKPERAESLLSQLVRLKTTAKGQKLTLRTIRLRVRAEHEASGEAVGPDPEAVAKGDAHEASGEAVGLVDKAEAKDLDAVAKEGVQ